MEMGSPPGGQDTNAARDAGVGPPAQPPRIPPQPVAPPAPPGPTLADWLRTPRPEAEPGIWRCGHQPLPPEDPDRTPTRQLVAGAVVSLLLGWLVWSLLWNGYLGGYWLWPLLALTPEEWRSGPEHNGYMIAAYFYYALVLAGLAVAFGRLGHWGELLRRAREGLQRANRRADGVTRTAAPVVPTTPAEDPAAWPQLRGADPAVDAAAERLTADLHAGLMNDVDHARLTRAWLSGRARPDGVRAFTDAVLREGAAAWTHPSGDRDLPVRAARHDLSLQQVRVGTAAVDERNPQEYRGAGIVLDPDLLGTSALVVGPAGCGKSTRLARPVVESLCLQALAGQAAVVAVTSSTGRPVAAEAFDVVVRPGRPDSTHDLDLYGGTDDPDEAAAMLAEALVGDLASGLPGGDSRRAATTLAQLLGPFRAAYGRFPGVPELRELLDGSPDALDGLRKQLRDVLDGSSGLPHLRELDAYERHLGRPGDTASLLADRIALLDRPAFADFFVPEGGGEGGAKKSPRAHRPFSLRALEHPLRVRVDLPERGHAEASRIIARLVLAQFLDCALDREDRSLFAGLVLDDADRTVTPQALRGLQRLRSANAGVMLTMRALDDVPEPLRAPLLGAVGCRVVCSGVTPWDAERFAEAWGTEWVETRDVTNRQLVSDEPLTRLVHGIRRMVTGRHVTAESVTVRRVQRQRWSASDLANELQPGHAVLSFTTVRGRRTPPVLARLED